MLDRLTSIELAALREGLGAGAWDAFAQPGTAIDLLTADLQHAWDHHLSSEFADRRTGRLRLESRAYVQWVGMTPGILVEVSSKRFPQAGIPLTEGQEQMLLRAGFAPPGEESPNFWLRVEDRPDCEVAAFRGRGGPDDGLRRVRGMSAGWLTIGIQSLRDDHPDRRTAREP